MALPAHVLEINTVSDKLNELSSEDKRSAMLLFIGRLMGAAEILPKSPIERIDIIRQLGAVIDSYNAERALRK